MSARKGEGAMDDTLNLPQGWVELTPGGALINAHPTEGGRIERSELTGRWEVAFNDTALSRISGLLSREVAMGDMQAVIKAVRRYRTGHDVLSSVHAEG